MIENTEFWSPSASLGFLHTCLRRSEEDLKEMDKDLSMKGTDERAILLSEIEDLKHSIKLGLEYNKKQGRLHREFLEGEKIELLEFTKGREIRVMYAVSFIDITDSNFYKFIAMNNGVFTKFGIKEHRIRRMKRFNRE